MHISSWFGILAKKTAAATEWTLVSAPAGVTNLSPRPSYAKYRRKTMVTGEYSPPVVWLDDLGVYRKMGVVANTTVPVLAAGAGGVMTGIFIAYATFAEMNGSAVVAEGNPSTDSNEITLTNGSLVVSNLPTTSTDARVTHVRIYLSVDGDPLPKLAKTLAIGSGSTTIDIDGEVLANSVTLPAKLDDTGVVELDADARGVPPYGLYNKTYHDRLWVTDQDNPSYIWFSMLFEPESFNRNVTDPLAQLGYLKTKNGEAVTGLGVFGDTLLVFVYDGCYAVQGYGPGDFTIEKISSRFGCISHHSICNVGDGSLWWASEEGVCMYNGGFHLLMSSTLRDYWRDDYLANQAAYENCIAADDKDTNVYKLVVTSAAPSFAYVGHYLPTMPSLGGSGSAPHWSFDIEGRLVTTIGVLYDSGHQKQRLYQGNADGYMRLQNVAANEDDDGDSYLKALTIQTKHFFPKGQSGSDNEALTFIDFDTFMVHETNAVTVSVFAGDDSAAGASVAMWTRSLPATAKTRVGTSLQPQTSQRIALTGVAGKGITFRYTCSSPLGVEWRGLEFAYWGTGPQTRG